MAINKKLLHFVSKSNFSTQLANSNIDSKSIVFIKDTGEIWTHDKLYSCASWGTNQTNYVPLIIGGTSYNLSKDGHTHSYVPISGASFIQSTGRSTSWGNTNGTSTGAFNAVMGTTTSATWLLSGTSSGVFRTGIQSLDSNGTMRFYVGSNYMQYDGSTLAATNFNGNGASLTSLNGSNISSGTVADARIAAALTGKTYNGLTVTSTTGTLTLTSGKTLAVGNSITLSAPADGRTLNIGPGGTLGTAAFTNIAEYAPQSTISATLPATVGWYRIATSSANINRCSARFEIDWALSGYHGQVTINAGVMYGQDPTLNMIHYAHHGTSLTKARIVYHSTYSGNYAYLEVYNSVAVALVVNVQMFSSLGWSLVTPSTVGSIPTGYSNREITFYDGIVTEGQLVSSIATGTAPLVVSSTTAVTNLNADLLDGYHASTSANANTIVQRDSSGNVYASNLYLTNSTAGLFKHGSDGILGVTGNLYPKDTTMTQNIGASGYKWNSVYANSFVGTATNADKLNNISSSDFDHIKPIGYHPDYRNIVILLFDINAITNHRINGRFYSAQSGGGRYTSTDVDIWYSRWTTGFDRSINVFNKSSLGSLDLVTCVYNGITYLALKYDDNVQAKSWYFNGTGTESFTMVEYYNSQTSTVINSEIYNSLTDVDSWNTYNIKHGAKTFAYTDSNVASATKLQTARTIAGVSFDGTANISIPFANLSSKPTTLSGYGITDALLKSDINVQVGGAKNSQMLWASWDNTSVYGGAIQIREYRSVGSTQSDWYYSPAITFHWGNRAVKRFGMRSDGQLAIDNNPILWSGNYSSYALPLSGGTITGSISVAGSITNLSNSGGGIFWNPYAESASDGSDAASISVATSGGSTVMSIKQMNDANDYINFLVNSNTNGVRINGNAIYNAGNFSVTLNGTSTTSANFYAPTSQLSVQSGTNSYLIGASSTTSLGTVYSNAGVYMNGSKLYTGDIQASGSITASNLWGISSKNISLTLTTNWQDTGILMNDSTLFASGSGTYTIELSSDTPGVSSQWGMRYSGIMAVFTSATNSTDTDEITLHSMGHASNGRHIYLRTVLQASPNYAKIQIATSAAWSGAGTITIKTRRII